MFYLIILCIQSKPNLNELPQDPFQIEYTSNNLTYNSINEKV